MNRILCVLALACVLSVALGCTTTMTTGVWAPIMNSKTPFAVGDTSVGQSKVGTAEVEGIILLARGDASISAACASAGITKIHHIDSEDFSVMGIYSRKIITVYGE